MEGSETKKAVIYCRVSDPKQMQRGDGLSSQETRSRDFAKHKGYEVVAVFKEEGISGSLMDRPQMQAMLKFLKAGKHKHQYVVIIDDISRLARDLEAHIKLRTMIADVDAKLESPSIEFGEDSDSKLVERMLASVAAHQREKNAEQTKNRMQARVKNGYWIANPPPGYRFDHVAGHNGRVMIKDDPCASVVKEALESFASGKLETQGEIKRFLDASPHYPKGRNGEVHYSRVRSLLTNVLYAGYINVPKWGIKLQPAQHEALISFETYQKIQERLNEKAKAPIRKDIKIDFPLRGFVTCNCCGHPMTSCWSKGRSGKYPYYLCFTKGCDEYRKSIRKELMEDEFEELLHTMRPQPELLYMAKEMIEVSWEAHMQSLNQDTGALKAEIRQIERKVEQFLDRIIETDNPTLISTYEKKISTLEEQRVALNEKTAMCGRPLKSFDESFRTAIDFLGNPCKLWASDRLEDKRTVLRLAFSDKLPYRRNEGFRTAQTSLPFSLLEDLRGGKSEMARPARFELTTF